MTDTGSRKNIPRLFALFFTWLLVLVFFLWGVTRNLSLFTMIWRAFVIAVVTYGITYYYLN